MTDAPVNDTELRDWPCTNSDHLGLCVEGHVHADHQPANDTSVASTNRRPTP